MKPIEAFEKMDRPCTQCGLVKTHYRGSKAVCIECFNARAKQARLKRIEDGLCIYCSDKAVQSNKCEKCLGTSKAQTAKWAKANPDKVYAAQKRANRRLKEEVFAAYGNACVCCGETTFEFLSIDHINGGGTKHRKELAAQNTDTYTWLRKNKWPEGFRILCFNCHMAISFSGYCPHKGKPNDD